jgi:hypothetical protein
MPASRQFCCSKAFSQYNRRKLPCMLRMCLESRVSDHWPGAVCIDSHHRLQETQPCPVFTHDRPGYKRQASRNHFAGHAKCWRNTRHYLLLSLTPCSSTYQMHGIVRIFDPSVLDLRFTTVSDMHDRYVVEECVTSQKRIDLVDIASAQPPHDHPVATWAIFFLLA